MDASKKFWMEFFALYRSLPCLWKFKCPEYSNRKVKTKAYGKLLEKFREFYPDATKQMLMKKINIMRTSYRREANKVQNSEMAGDTGDDLYVPSLWYFETLSFLADRGEDVTDDNDNGRSSMEFQNFEEYQSSMDMFSEDENTYLNEEKFWPSAEKKLKRDETKQATKERKETKKPKNENTSELKPQQKCSKKNLSKLNSTPEVDIALPSHSRTDDEIATISSTWGILYRDLEPRQKLYANKAINEVLYQGALGKLHEYSYKAIESPQQVVMTGVEDNNIVGITIDRVNYNDPEYQLRGQNIGNPKEALNYLKPLEQYAIQENRAALGLLKKLEESLKKVTNDG